MAEGLPQAEIRRQSESHSHGRSAWRKAAILLGLMALGFFLGFAPLKLWIEPLLGDPVPPQQGLVPPANPQAAILDVQQIVDWTGDRPVLRLKAAVMNTSAGDLDNDLYWFEPATPGLSVLPLPRSIKAFDSLELDLRIELPAQPRNRASWRLTGPKGPVPGGELTIFLAAPVP